MICTAYFDNSATTKPCETAVKYINDVLLNDWANPSSLHSLGISAEQQITLTKKSAASIISATPEEIFFTGSGTEANNIAIFGAVNSAHRLGNRIVTSAIEHPSVSECMKKLEKDGFEVIYLKPHKNGVLSEEDIYNAIDRNTILVSIMLINNETGAIQPVNIARQAITASGSPALLHCDAVQAFGKLPINVKKLDIDLMSASGHKVHASKGIGFLYKKRNVRIVSPVLGGGQEGGIRSGTQAVASIAGLRGAIEELPELNNQLHIQQELFDYTKDKLKSINSLIINSPEGCLPYILNISVDGYKSETMMHFLESKGIFVSSGSACSKGKKSNVLRECGLSDRIIDSALRISFSRYNTKSEVDLLCSALSEGCRYIRKAY